MKYRFEIALVFILISFNSCEKRIDEKEYPTSQTENGGEEQFYFDCKQQTIKGIKYKGCIGRPGIFTIEDSDGKIIYERKANPLNFEFTDFNGDGFSDIKMSYVSNSHGLQELLLFDTETNEFKEVQSFNKYPNSLKIENAKYYYSYERNGCADNDWSSKLFKINGSEIIEIGQIQGFGCRTRELNGIYIYKIINTEKKLLRFYKNEQGLGQEKFKFIKRYWSENKGVFE